MSRAGIGAARLRIWKRLRHRARTLFGVRRVLFFEADIADECPDREPPCVPGIRLSEAGNLAEVAHYDTQLVARFGLSHATIMQRMAQGHRLVVALDGDAVVAMLWMAFESQLVSEVGMTLRLKPGEMLTYHAETLPAWRNRGISTALNKVAACAARQRLATRHLAWREAENAPALRVAEKLGQRRIAMVTAVWAFGLSWMARVEMLNDVLLTLV